MNRRILALVILAACAVLLALSFLWIPESVKRRITAIRPTSDSIETSALNGPVQSTSAGQSKVVSITPNAQAAVSVPVFTQTDNLAQQRAAKADQQFIEVAGMLRDYRSATGQDPIGNNSEITKALLGTNPRGVRFNMPDMKLDNAGQLLDRWGHPYFFHQISKIDTEVRSAGPDGIMWTADDEVLP